MGLLGIRRVLGAVRGVRVRRSALPAEVYAMDFRCDRPLPIGARMDWSELGVGMAAPYSVVYLDALAVASPDSIRTNRGGIGRSRHRCSVQSRLAGAGRGLRFYHNRRRRRFFFGRSPPPALRIDVGGPSRFAAS